MAIIGILAGAVTPNLMAWRRGADERAALLAVERLTIRARDEAATSGRTTEVVYDAAERTFTATLNPPSEEENGEGESLGTVRLPESLEPESFRQSGADRSAADWKEIFRPDGTAETSSVRLGVRSFVVDARARITVSEDEPEIEGDEEWEAGDFERRAAG